MTDSPPLTAEELVALPKMRRDLDLFDAYRAEDVRRLLDIIDRLDAALRATRAKASGEGLRCDWCGNLIRSATEHEPWCQRRHTGDCVDGPSERATPAPAGLDVERLARAIGQTQGLSMRLVGEPREWVEYAIADAIAAEYARLQPAPLTGEDP